MADRPKKVRNQKFIAEYAKKWPCLKAAENQNNAFCNVCNTSFSVAHGGADDCRRHCIGPKHQKLVSASEKSKTVTSYFNIQSRTDAIRAAALFAKFVIEHNLPISAADHAGPLFKVMFPDSEIAKNYNAARTKTTAMISFMAKETAKDIESCMKAAPYALSTDGSNDGRTEQLYPLVVRYFDDIQGKSVCALLCILSNTEASTGSNIFDLIDQELVKRSIPWSNCISFGCDNAAVMTGKYKGVSKFILEKQPNAFIQGCPCHLIHIAAQNAASELSCVVDELLIDIYFYLNKSTKRQQALKCFQNLCNVQARKIIKHVSTRWLSLETCILRLLEQWVPLQEFFNNEKASVCPKVKQKKDGKASKQKGEKRLSSSEVSTVVRKKIKLSHTKKLSRKPDMSTGRLTRICILFDDPKTKLYCLFLKNVLPAFNKANALLQSEEPLIHKLRRILLELLTDLYVRFVTPNAISQAGNILSVKCDLKCNQRDNSTTVIGSEAKCYLNELQSEEKINQDEIDLFYANVKNFYSSAVKYIAEKCNIGNPLLECAEVADISLKKDMPFLHVEYFSKFQGVTMLPPLDNIEVQFRHYQIEELSSDITECSRMDVAWHKISELKNLNGEYKFQELSILMKHILIIPHSNAESERIFSIVRKNLTDFRPNLSNEMLSNLLVEKMHNISRGDKCFNTTFSKETLIALKSV